ncbi:MAG TPA: hypothetical protein VF595_17650 [Tepidisphaeraceae bacterium]
MPLAQSTTYVQTVLPFFMFDGMTLLLGTFFFYCLAHPQRIRSRTPFWGVFGCLLLIVLLYTLRLMLYTSPAGQVLTGVVIGLLQAGGLVLTVLYVGGLRVGEMADELKNAADFRHGGETAKSAVTPSSGEPATPRGEPTAAVPRSEPMSPTPAAAAPPRVVIDLPKKDDGALPLA